MTRHKTRLSAIVGLLVCTACGGGPGVETQALPVSGIGAGSSLDVDDLRQELLSFADRAMGEMARVADAAMAVDSTATTRAFVRALQADVAAASLALSVEPDPEAAVQDLIVTLSTRRRSLRAGAPEGVDPAAIDLLERSVAGLEQGVWGVARQFFPPAELSALESRLDLWQTSQGDKAASAGVVRVADLPGAGGPGMGKGLFSPLTDATRQLESSVLLGERFLFLAERLPVVTMWQAEALTWEILAAPESRQALNGLAVMSSTLEKLALTADSLPALFDGQRAQLLADFDDREGALRDLLDQAGATMSEAEMLASSGERVAELSTEAAAGLSEALVAAERLVKSLRDANAPGGAMSFEIDRYGEALDDFRASAEALNEALAKAEGLAGTPRSTIDHAALRVGQLMLLFFALLAAYRFGPALLTKKKEAGA